MLKLLTKKQKEWVSKTIGELSVREKIGQLINVRGSLADNEDFLKKYPVGSINAGGEIIEGTIFETEDIRKFAKRVSRFSGRVPLLLSADVECGLGNSFAGMTRLPHLMNLSASFDPKLAYEFGRAIAREARLFDIRWIFGPVADLNLNDRNPVTNIRSTGNNPEHALTILKPLVNGIQENGCAACLKHFPGDGTDSRNQHIATSINSLALDDWHKTYGSVFGELIREGAMSIMAGHIALPAYETETDGKFCPATASRKIIGDLLRDELSFEGLICTDALSMNGYHSWKEDYRECLLDTFHAGADIFIWPRDTEEFFNTFETALQTGRASMERLDDAVRHVLEFKARLGLCPDEPGESPEASSIRQILAEDAELPGKIMRKSITLLRNRKHILPLKLPANAKILIYMAQDTPSVRRNIYKLKDLFAARGFSAIEANLDDIWHLHGLHREFELILIASFAGPMLNNSNCASNLFWNIMEWTRGMKRIAVSFGTPYFLYEIPEIETYINVCTDIPPVPEILDRLLFGELPFRGKSPVSRTYCFQFKDGEQTEIK